MATQESPTETPEEEAPAPPAVTGFKKKTLIWIVVVTLAAWAFAIQTGSTILMIVIGALTVVEIGVLLYAFRQIKKQRGLVDLLQGAASSPEARRDALSKLAEGKDATSPTNLFARAQLMGADDPKGALKLLESIELKTYPAAMQDDVSLLKTQLYLGIGRTADARRAADTMNLDNPSRAEIRPFAASIVAEAWARTGKPKEALALLDTIELPKKNAEQIALQIRVARVFAKFASNQRNGARTELNALAAEDVNQLGRFVMPQFRVHPELQKLARQVYEGHPAARKMVKQAGGGRRRP